MRKWNHQIAQFSLIDLKHRFTKELHTDEIIFTYLFHRRLRRYIFASSKIKVFEDQKSCSNLQEMLKCYEVQLQDCLLSENVE